MRGVLFGMKICGVLWHAESYERFERFYNRSEEFYERLKRFYDQSDEFYERLAKFYNHSG